MAGTWVTCTPTPISASGPFFPDTMILLTDGSVLVHNADAGNSAATLAVANEWLRYTPDAKGNYATGTWSPVAPMANARQFFASGVLRDGRVFVIGGEDSDAGNDTPLGEIFDPVINLWSPINKPPAFDFIAGDASGCILADGRVLLGAVSTDPTQVTLTAIWDPSQDSWVQAGTRFGTIPTTKNTNSNEETWTLLPDGTVLTVETFATAADPTAAQKYLPEFDEWVSAGDTPQALALQTLNGIGVEEIGPAILLPNGMLFAIGATGNTAIYMPPLADPIQEGTWFAGPQFPADTSVGSVWPLLTSIDAPACLQPNGKVLCVAGTSALTGGHYFSQSATVFEYDPSNPEATLPPLASQPPGSTDPWTWETRFLLTPSGEVLYSAGQSQDSNIYLYSPDAGPNPTWRPHITTAPEQLRPGHAYRLYGRQINGLSQAVSYGDDAQMATNYPIVRLRAWGGTDVFYCRTFDHSTMAVATGDAIHHTHFMVPPGLPFGKYELIVVANGIASRPKEVHVGHEREEHRGYRDHQREEERVEHDDKYKDKDKDAKEVKEKEKDAKEAKEKEKDFKDVKEKDTKEFKEKEKDCKDVEQKHCKEKEHKEFEHKGCKDKEHKEHKEKDCPEQSYCPPHEKSRDHDELLHRIGRLVERIERIEDEARRRPFIRDDERPPVGERALRRHEDERRHDENERARREDERRRHEDDIRRADEERRHEQERLQEEERRRHDEERRGAEARQSPPASAPPEPPNPRGQRARGKR